VGITVDGVGAADGVGVAVAVEKLNLHSFTFATRKKNPADFTPPDCVIQSCI
jgi:hypothetical protein